MICEGKAVQKGSFAVVTQKCYKTANINVKTAVYTLHNYTSYMEFAERTVTGCTVDCAIQCTLLCSLCLTFVFVRRSWNDRELSCKNWNNFFSLHVGICLPLTRLSFIVRQHANSALLICDLSVCLSVCLILLLHRNDCRYSQNFYHLVWPSKKLAF